MKVKINYKNSTPKFVNDMILGKITLVTESEDATEFSGQCEALFYLGLIAKYLKNESPQDDVIKSIEFC